LSVHLYLELGGQDTAAAIDAQMRALAAQRSSWLPTRLHIWLSGALARPFLFGPVTGLKGWREAQEAAAAVAPSICGLTAPCVTFVESDPTRVAVTATAVEASLIEALYESARVHRMHIASVRPAWARVLEHQSPERPDELLLCCRERDALTILAATGDRMLFAATYCPAPSGMDVESLLRRLQASLGLNDESLAVVDLVASTRGQVPDVRWIGRRAPP
jgi:hypothetical protein